VLFTLGIDPAKRSIRESGPGFVATFGAGTKKKGPQCGPFLVWRWKESGANCSPSEQGKRRCLWRAVDQDGDLTEILMRNRKDARAAKRFFRKALRSQLSVPIEIKTDKPLSYGAARAEICQMCIHVNLYAAATRDAASSATNLQTSILLLPATRAAFNAATSCSGHPTARAPRDTGFGKLPSDIRR